MKKRGRPKGRSRDSRTFGPLADLIRTHRFKKKLGLLDVARDCKCSVQFISNIEHGRAPLPWKKAEKLASVLKIPLEELQIANLANRSDFKNFLSTAHNKKRGKPPVVNKMLGSASTTAMIAQDAQLQKLIKKYQLIPSVDSKKKFVRAALQILDH